MSQESQKFDNNGKAGLWQKTSQKGNTYFSGKIEIEGKMYFIALFDNMSKKRQNPKAPDFQLMLNPADDNPNDTPF